MESPRHCAEAATEARLVDGVWRPKSDFHAAVPLGFAGLREREGTGDARARQDARTAGHNCGESFFITVSVLLLAPGNGPYKLALCGEQLEA